MCSDIIDRYSQELGEEDKCQKEHFHNKYEIILSFNYRISIINYYYKIFLY